MHVSPRLALMLSIPPLLWAGNAVVGRQAIQHIGPLWLNTLRWCLALLLLLPLVWHLVADPRQRAQIARRWRYLFALGLVGVGAYNALQYLALLTSPPLNVTLIASSMPLWMMASGLLWFGERPTRGQAIGAVLSLAGVAVVLGRGDLAVLWQVRFVPGDLLMMLAAFSWSIYSWMLARPPAHMRGDARPAWDWAAFLALQIVFGLVWAVAGAGLGEAVGVPSPTPQWGLPLIAALAYVAVFPSLVAYRLWGLGVAEAGPALAAFFSNLTPLFAAILSAAWLGQWPQGYHALAFALIVAGIAVSAQRAKR